MTDYDKLLKQARQAGLAAAEAREHELEAAGPVWAVVENAKGDFASDPSKPPRVVGTMHSLCGFAWVHFSCKGEGVSLWRWIIHRLDGSWKPSKTWWMTSKNTVKGEKPDE